MGSFQGLLGNSVGFFDPYFLSLTTMEDLITNWNRLTLSDKEGPGCSLDEELSSPEFIIATKFLTKRTLNIDAIAKTFTPLWRSKNGFRVCNLGDHKVLFVFDNKAEADKVIHSEPWTFDKHLIVMERYDTTSSLDDLTLDKTTFWVQVHGLPIKFMNVKAAEKICEALGTVIPTANPAESEGGNFIRVRVTMDITGPLCHGWLVSTGGEKQIWISFKYERLPNICYWCGCFNHDDKDCEVWLNSEGSLTVEMKQFGPSLRVAPFSSSRKQVIAVPGFYKSRSNQTPDSAKRAPVGNRSDGDKTVHTSTHTEPPYSPPQGNHESGEVRQSRSVTVTLEEHQHSMRSVTCSESPGAVLSNGSNSSKSINPIPLNEQSTELHLNENGRALNEFESGKNSTHIEEPSNLPFTESRPYAFMENNHTIPDPIGNILVAFNSELLQDLHTHEAIFFARDSQSSRASTLAFKPQWTRVSCASPTPKEAVSQGNLNYGKRPFTLGEDHSKLPNIRCQVSRSEEDDYTKLAEVYIQPCQSP